MFNTARNKLTLLYLAIITFITVSFSLVTYRLLTAEVDRFARFQRSRIEQRLIFENDVPLPDFDLIRDTKNRIAFGLFLIDGIVVVVSGGLAFLLAGKTLEPIQEMVEDQRRFVADSSHELRTPLTSLKIATEVALRDKKLSTTEAKSILKDNLLEINKLSHLSDNLLRLAQYDSQKTKVSLSRVSSKKISTQAVENVSLLAKNKKITIENEVKNFHITGNEVELVDLLVILLDNAIKYSPENSLIKLDSRKTKNFLYLSVIDQGEGIPESDRTRVFERFYRSDKSRTGAAGFGLGLSIAKRIADSHRGTIKVSGRTGGGSQFEIKLPLAGGV